tara:strand:- start:1804 stop:2049 length:246 start_codon:yes stop_codon:yes gene_type:complete
MKTYQQFAEDAKEINKLKDTIMSNRGVKKLTGNLKQGNINIKDLKNFAHSNDAKNLKSAALNTLINVGQGYLNKAKEAANK